MGCGNTRAINPPASASTPSTPSPNSTPTSASTNAQAGQGNQGAIKFPLGGTFTSVSGNLAPQNIDRYTFQANAGQPANLTINSPKIT